MVCRGKFSTVSPSLPAFPYSTATSRLPIAADVITSEVEYCSLVAPSWVPANRIRESRPSRVIAVPGSCGTEG